MQIEHLDQAIKMARAVSEYLEALDSAVKDVKREPSRAKIVRSATSSKSCQKKRGCKLNVN